MEKDCNTCASHVQATSIDNAPEECWNCFDNVRKINRNWTPIKLINVNKETPEVTPMPPVFVGAPFLPNEEFDETTKPTNPKDAIGSDKLPLHLWPETATIHGCLALLDGCGKYGRSNYRAVGVRASIYVDACKRHLNAWMEGEECAADSGVHHLGHALACLAVVLDAEAAGKLEDDRMYPGGYHALVEKLTPMVKAIKARHAGRNPTHYTKQTARLLGGKG